MGFTLRRSHESKYLHRTSRSCKGALIDSHAAKEACADEARTHSGGIGLVVGVGLAQGWTYMRRVEPGPQAHQACYGILREANKAYRHVGDVGTHAGNGSYSRRACTRRQA
jgi:hypothetical protein